MKNNIEINEMIENVSREKVKSVKEKAKTTQVEDTTDIAKSIGEAIAENFNKAISAYDPRVNQGTSAAIQINKKVQDKATRQLEFQRRITADLQNKKNCRMYAIPKIYKEYQPSFTVSINGCTIHVPSDGVPRLIHNRYIDIIEQRLRHIDEKISAMQSPDIQLISR